MELQYIKAVPEDAGILFDFNKELIDTYEDRGSIYYEGVLSWIRRKLEKKIDEYVCITVDGRKAAWYRFAPSEGEMELDDLYVLPEFRGQGIGTQIIEKCCSETNLPVFLYVFSRNTGAVRLYERLGFQIAEEVGGTRYIMRRVRNK